MPIDGVSDHFPMQAEPASAEKRPKSPGLFAKLLAPFKHEKKEKVKSPKKEAKKLESEAVRCHHPYSI
jgi:hypothetical protein